MNTHQKKFLCAALKAMVSDRNLDLDQAMCNIGSVNPFFDGQDCIAESHLYLDELAHTIQNDRTFLTGLYLWLLHEIEEQERHNPKDCTSMEKGESTLGGGINLNRLLSTKNRKASLKKQIAKLEKMEF